MAQPSHNSLGSVLPQLGPLCSTIHSPGSWVRWPKPSWILSLGFIGWQLIYPLYTFQIIGLSLQGRKEEPQRGEKNTLWVLCPSPRGFTKLCCMLHQRACSESCSRAPWAQHPGPRSYPSLHPRTSSGSEMQRTWLLHLPCSRLQGVLGGQLWDTDRPACTGCYGNHKPEVWERSSTRVVRRYRWLTTTEITRNEKKKSGFPTSRVLCCCPNQPGGGAGSSWTSRNPVFTGFYILTRVTLYSIIYIWCTRETKLNPSHALRAWDRLCWS